MFEQYKSHSDRSETAQVLIAGCGTGRHAIMSATKYSNVNILAIDLSTSSLAYAKRCSDELGINNITFKQADILKLNELDQRFHLIESGGVLHHIEQTDVALKALVDLLYPGGLIMIGVYSTISRHNVHRCRDYFNKRGYGKTVEDVLRARQKIFSMDDSLPEKRILQSLDFYSLSACRDLLFHQHEHTYQLPELAEMLQRNNLDFLGFELDDMQVRNDYRQQFPDDSTLTNMEYWHTYEKEHPRTFAGMYIMWCQKI
jgi:ubiquinone/menaquinone biosynthesis C-methylase UbiE